MRVYNVFRLYPLSAPSSIPSVSLLCPNSHPILLNKITTHWIQIMLLYPTHNLILLRQGPRLALELAITTRLALNSPSSWIKAICHHTDHRILMGVQEAPRFLSRTLCSSPAASRGQQTVIKTVGKISKPSLEGLLLWPPAGCCPQVPTPGNAKPWAWKS